MIPGVLVNGISQFVSWPCPKSSGICGVIKDRSCAGSTSVSLNKRVEKFHCCVRAIWSVAVPWPSDVNAGKPTCAMMERVSQEASND